MNSDKKYIVFDAYVFGLRTILAYIRPLFLTGLLLGLFFIGVFGVGIVFLKPLFQGIKPLLQGMMPHMNAIDGMADASHGQMMMEKLMVLWQVRWIIPVILLVVLFCYSLTVAVYANYALIMFDGKATQKVTFPSFMKIIKIMIAKCIQCIVAFIGLILLIAPGIYWIVKTQFIDYAILDGAGIFEAFSKSFALSKGYGWAIFAYILLTITIGALLPTAFFLYWLSVFACGFIYRTIQKSA